MEASTDATSAPPDDDQASPLSPSQVRQARLRRLDPTRHVASPEPQQPPPQCDSPARPPAEPRVSYERMSNRQLRSEARRRGLRGEPHIGRGNRRNALLNFLRYGSLENLDDCWVEGQ